MIKAIVFDIDGVLVNTKHVHYTAFNEALQENGYDPIPYELHLQEYDGLPSRTKMDKLGIIDDKNRSAIFKSKQKYTVDLLNKIPYDRWIFSTLDVAAKDYSLLCATNAIKATADIILEKLMIKSFFTHILTNEDVTYPKPNPEIYFKCAHLIGCKPEELLVCEDSVVGMKAVLAAKANLCPILSPRELTLNTIHHFIRVYS